MDALINPSSFDSTPIVQLTYEQAFAQLEAIVKALESDEHPLNESLALYERGQFLSRHCAGLLDQADLKVHQISGEGLEDVNE